MANEKCKCDRELVKLIERVRVAGTQDMNMLCVNNTFVNVNNNSVWKYELGVRNSDLMEIRCFSALTQIRL